MMRHFIVVTKSKEDEMFENLSSAPIVYIYEDPQWSANDGIELHHFNFMLSPTKYGSELAITLTPATITTTVVWRH